MIYVHFLGAVYYTVGATYYVVQMYLQWRDGISATTACSS
jgi:hypothetical protein